MSTDIYSYVLEEEAGYTKPVEIADGWSWSMPEHLRRSFLYKNSQFLENNDNRQRKPFKNIVRPILNIQYRTEGFDVKDIELYVDSPKDYHKSFLVKKYHSIWARENGIDTFIDEMVESYVDYGAVLVKNVSGVRPEVVDLQSIAFCDQTDILSGPFAIKHFFSPDQLRDMESKGWGNSANGATIDIATLITLSENGKSTDSQDKQTPGKYIEVYEVHGILPKKYLNGEDDKTYVQQVQIIGYYKDQTGNKAGVTLFVKKEKLPFKLLLRDKVFGRACGFGGVEELFEPQRWTNFSEIQMTEMLYNASKTLYKTTDPAYKTRNNLANKENGDVLVLAEGKDIGQIDTYPRNLVAFSNSLNAWNEHAQVIGAAGDTLQGQSPSSGTPFKLQELITNEAKGLHIFRQGKIATFMDEIYQDWVLPYIVKELTNGQSFLAELSSDEFQEIYDRVVDNRLNKWQVEETLSGRAPVQEQIDRQKQEIQKKFTTAGLRQFVAWTKEDFKDIPIKVKTNIAGKQKNLALLTDKIVNVLRQFISTPQIRQDPQMLKLLNMILESSGMSPIIFSGALPPQPMQMPQEQGGGVQPLQELNPQPQNA